MLNLFCYTGSFTVYAAGGGASQSLSIDLSNTYLDWARHNFELNRLDPERHVLLRADVMRWLREAGASGERFDLIVLDPPVLSRSKAMAPGSMTFTMAPVSTITPSSRSDWVAFAERSGG